MVTEQQKQERMGRSAFILYKGGVKGEEPLDDRSTGEPLRVVIGENSIPRGIELALYDMEIGESKTVEVSPEQGYGYPSPDGIQWYPRTLVNNGAKLGVGDVIACTNKLDHKVLPGRVVQATDDLLQVDVNHPFAGKTLEYWVKLVDLH
jgi:FKBP-type peptidyl-prolyl cis-trans isomerase 2